MKVGTVLKFSYFSIYISGFLFLPEVFKIMLFNSLEYLTIVFVLYCVLRLKLYWDMRKKSVVLLDDLGHLRLREVARKIIMKVGWLIYYHFYFPTVYYLYVSCNQYIFKLLFFNLWLDSVLHHTRLSSLISINTRSQILLKPSPSSTIFQELFASYSQ